MDFMTTAGRIVSLFLIMVVGYMMNKAGIIDREANVRYTKLVINISLPAQIITAFISNRGIVSNQEVLMVFAITFAIYVVYGVLAILFTWMLRVPPKQKGTYLFMTMFGNIGFMGFPVITAIFGEEAMIYAVICNVVFNVLVYSIGITMISSSADGSTKFQWRRLRNMPLMAAGVSIFLYFTGIPLPEQVMTSLDFLGNVTTPVAMLILGSTIAGMPIRELFDEWRIYIFSALKLLVIPLVIIFLLDRFAMDIELLKGTLIVLAAMPVATNTTMLAIEYDGDVQLASKGIFFTTVLSILTIPLITMMC